MDAISLPPPYSGQKDDISRIDIASPYGEIVQNFNVDTGVAVLRRGDNHHQVNNSLTTSGAFRRIRAYGDGSTGLLFLAYDTGSGGTRIADVTVASTITDVYTPGGSGGDTEIQTLYFNNVLTFFGNVTWIPGGVGCPQWNGSAWSLSGYTYPSMTQPFGGGVYKNRAYIIERNSTKYAYSNINAITGATTEVDLNQIISRKGNLFAICSISLSEGVEQENVLCFVFDSGEVLVYSGSYPNSSDWRITGRFVISKPLSRDSFIYANGDCLVITSSGLFSIRSLFAQGPGGLGPSALSAPIENRWKAVMERPSSVDGQWVCGVYDEKKERIIIGLPDLTLRDTSTTTTEHLRLILSLSSGAWVEHHSGSGQGHSMETFRGEVFRCVSASYNAIIKLESPDSVDPRKYRDAIRNGGTVGYEFDILSAPLPIGRQRVTRGEGLDIILETDMQSEINYSFVGDFGVSTSQSQLNTESLTGVRKPYINIGLECSYLQYRINGTTAADRSIGLNIYGLNVWTQSGQSPR